MADQENNPNNIAGNANPDVANRGQNQDASVQGEDLRGENVDSQNAISSQRGTPNHPINTESHQQQMGDGSGIRGGYGNTDQTNGRDSSKDEESLEDGTNDQPNS